MAIEKKKIADAVKAGIKNFQDDEEFDPEIRMRSRLSDADADIMDFFDNLIGDGWVLKISKENPAGPPRFLAGIENFQNWGDPEIEISKIVQAKTAEEVAAYGRVRSWGSGLYRIALGNRNKLKGERVAALGKYHVLDIDALEPSSAQSTSQSSGMDAQTADLVKSLTVSPTDIAAKMAESFKLGAEQSKGGGDAMGVMMTGLFTLIGTLITAQGNKPQTDTFSEIRKLHEMGLVKLPGADDPAQQITKLKDLMELVRGFGGGDSGGGEPSLWAEVIRKLPLDRIPDMLNSAAAIAQSRGAAVPAQPAPQPMKVISPEQPAVHSEAQKEAEMKQLIDYLYQAVEAQDASQFPIITDSLAAYLGGKESVIAKIKSGIVTENILVASISKMDPRYTGEMLNKLAAYAHSYIEWIKAEAPTLIATCNHCSTEFEFSKEQFEKEKSQRGGKVLCNESGCEGELILNEARV